MLRIVSQWRAKRVKPAMTVSTTKSMRPPLNLGYKTGPTTDLVVKVPWTKLSSQSVSSPSSSTAQRPEHYVQAWLLRRPIRRGEATLVTLILGRCTPEQDAIVGTDPSLVKAGCFFPVGSGTREEEEDVVVKVRILGVEQGATWAGPEETRLGRRTVSVSFVVEAEGEALCEEKEGDIKVEVNGAPVGFELAMIG